MTTTFDGSEFYDLIGWDKPGEPDRYMNWKGEIITPNLEQGTYHTLELDKDGYIVWWNSSCPWIVLTSPAEAFHDAVFGV